MSELAKHYNELIGAIAPPKAIENATLDTPDVQEQRNEFFSAIKHSLESRLSALAIESCITIEKIISPDTLGKNADISEELTLHAGQPLAYAWQTKEHAIDVVRFGTIPVNRVGEEAFRHLEEADDGFSYAIFRA